MPYINLGGVHSKPSNYSLWVSIGGRGLDTARTYGDDVQKEVGAAIRASELNRSAVFLTTKIPCCPFHKPLQPSPWKPYEWCLTHPFESASAAIDADLKLLGVGYVDLLLLHWKCNELQQTVATYKALEKAVSQGKAKAIGVSNMNAADLEALLAPKWGLTIPPAINQVGFSVGYHNSTKFGSDPETKAVCERHNITYAAYSPLGGLSGIDVLTNPVVKRVASVHNKTPAQVALRWVVQQGVVAVTSSAKGEYDKADLEIFDFELSEHEMNALRAE